MLLKSILSSLISFSFINAECSIDYSVLYSIASCERHMNKKVGYPYLISVANEKDKKAIKKHLHLAWLDSRTIDCKSLDECIDNLTSIKRLKIENLDLGSFQLNFIYNKYPNKDYFTLKKSYAIACSIIEEHLSHMDNYSWNTIARYHSKTPVYNKRYAQCLEREYSKLLKG